MSYCRRCHKKVVRVYDPHFRGWVHMTPDDDHWCAGAVPDDEPTPPSDEPLE